MPLFVLRAASDTGAPGGSRGIGDVLAFGVGGTFDPASDAVGPGVQIQREDDTSLPPVPSYQLSSSLLEPRPRYPGVRLGQDLQLRLSPEMQLLMLDSVRSLLSPSVLVDAISHIDYSVLDQPPPAVNPFALPSVPTPPPLVPRGAGPSRPRAASPADFARAALAVPTFRSGLDRLGDFATDRLRRDWSSLGTGGQIGVVSWLTVIGGGALAGVVSDPTSRSWALSQLNGRVLPVPGLDWLHLEINTGESSLMVGTHVDVGKLLQRHVPQLGFGSSSPNAIGGPPRPQPFVPGSIGRAAAEPDSSAQTAGRVGLAGRGGFADIAGVGSVAGLGGLAGRISNEAGRGSRLPLALRGSLERELGTDLAAVRVHDDASSDALARELRSHAFATGTDVYFCAGRYAPGTIAGRQLIAHEAAHVAQQQRGRVTAPTAGLQVSEPGDAMEVEANRFAAEFASRCAEDQS
jgi:hypothetical protein